MRVMISGGGRLGYFLAKALVESGHQVTVLERERPEAEELARQLPQAVVVLGNASHPDVLEDAGALGTDVFIAATPDDANNLISCQQAARRFHIPRTLAVVGDPRNETIFRRLGIGTVFCPTSLIITAIEHRVAAQQLIEAIPIEEGKLQVFELALDQDDPAVGKMVRDLRLPAQSILAAIIRGDEPIIPRGDTVLDSHDRVIIVCRYDAFMQAAEAVCDLEDASILEIGGRRAFADRRPEDNGSHA